MFFSVIVACRNEVKFIENCITSLFNQNFDGRYEVIVVDGMSEDGTFEKLKDLKKKFVFQLFQNPVLNAAAGRNKGIRHARGDFMAFIDADAIAKPDWLKQIKITFDNNPDIIGVGGPDKLPNDSSTRSRMIGQVMTSSLARGGKLNPSTQHSLMDENKIVDHIPTCNLCLKKEVFNIVGLFDERFVKGQDLELNYRIVHAGFRLLYSPKIQVEHHRKHHVRDFSRQIFKWAKAKVAIIKKHGFDGLVSHVYLWPLYALIVFILSFLLFFILKKMYIFSVLVFLGWISYIMILLVESVNLTKRFQNNKLFFYSFFLLVVVHVSYAFGVFTAIIKRKIW